MSCVNPNSPEFQEILKQEPNFLLAELLYQKKMMEQSVQLYDDVRDLKSESPVKSKKEFIGETTNWNYPKVDSLMRLTDSDLIQLINEPKFKITDPIDLEKFNELSNAIGEKEAYRDYFENNQVVRPSAVVLDKLNKRVASEDIDPINTIDDLLDGPMLTADDFINDFNKVVQIENETVAIAVAEKLSKQLGIPYEIITMEDMQKLFPNQPYRKNFYQAGKVYLVAGAFDQNSVFHEFSHPIIKSMSIQNPAVFESLFSELASTDLGQEILNDLRGDVQYAEGTPEFMEEAIVRSLEAINENTASAPEGFIKNLFFQIKQFLRKIFGKKIDVSKLNSNTTLSDIVKMINYGEEFILDTNFLDNNLMVMFQTDYEAIKSQFKDSSAKRTQDIMNQFYSVVKLQLANFKAKNDIYKTIESQLADENREGVLNQMQQILEGIVTLGSNKLITPLDQLNITGNTALDKDILEFNQKINSFVKVISMADQMFDILANKINDLKSSGVKTNEEFDQLFAIMQYNDDWLAKINFWKTEFTTYNTITQNTAFGNVNGSDNPIRTALEDLEEKLQNNKNISDELQAESVIDILYDHLQKQLAPVKKDFLDQMASAKAAGMINVYNDLHKQYYGVDATELAELNRLKARPESSMSMAERVRLNDLTFLSYDSHNISKEALKARAEGKLGDSNKWNGLFESYMNNQDTIVGGFYSFLMKTFNTIDGNANAKRADMLEGLQPLLKAAGYDTHWLGDGKMGKEISQVNRSFEKDNLGNVKEYMEYRFMNNFVNHEFDHQELLRKIEVARFEYNNNPSDKFKKEFNDAKNALEKFEEDYMHRDYVQAYYDVRKKYFSTPIGEKAKEALQDIFDRMEIFAENVNLDPTNFGSVQALNDLWTEYQRLHSLYDVFGEEKTGDAKEIAEILSGFRNDMSDFYEWEEREDAFENAFARFNQALLDQGKLPGSDAHTKAVEKWLEQNTTIAVKEDYYQIREDLMFQRSQLIAPIQDMNNSLIDIAPMYKMVFDILKPTKDNFNQFDGNQLTPEAQEKIRDTQQTISNIKDQWIQLYGGTKEELRKYREIEEYQANNNGQFRTVDDADFYFDFWDEMSARLMLDFNLTKDDIIYIRDLDKTLSSMSTSGLTEHYVSTFLNFYNTNAESAKIFYDAFKFIEFKDGDVPTAKHIYEVMSDVKFSKDLSSVNPEFKAWFERNHYTQLVNEYDTNDGSFIDEVLKNRPTSAWQYTMPDDLQYYEAKFAIGANIPGEFTPNGYIELNGTPRIPTRAYYRRNVKADYETKKIERDFVDPKTGELVLATVDNRDRWLPRDYVPGKSDSAKDSKYIDANYKQTFDSNRALWDLQDHLKKSHLDNQKGLDNAQKLFLSYPRYRKGDIENYSKGYFKRKKDRIASNFNVAADDAELGLFTGNTRKEGYTTLTRPVGGSYRLPFNDVSTNIIDSMMDHMYSIEHFKGMRKVNSFANIFEKTMTQFAKNPTYTVLEQQLKDAALLTPNKDVDKHYRINQIKSIMDKHFKGITIAGNPSDLELTGLKAVGGLQKWMSFTSFALDPIKSLTNYFGGKSMMWKKSVEGDLYNAKDLVLSRGKSASIITELIGRQYSNKQVSAKLQLADVLGAIPGNLKKEIGSRGSKTVAQSIVGGKFFYFDRRYLSESVPVHQFLAILQHNSFMLDGKMTSLDDAVEVVNGRVQTKPGVPKDMSISYDGNGDIVMGDKLKDIMNAHQSLLQKSLGIGSEFTEPEMYRTMMGKYVMFLLKFFPGMLFDRYQVRTKKGKRGQRRLNYATRRAEVGTYLSAVKLIQEMISNKGKFWQFNKFSWQAKKGAMQYALAYLISIAIKMLTQSTGFDDDDDDLIDFTFDMNEEGMYSKLRKSTALPALPLVSDHRTLMRSGRSFNSENYLKLQALRLMLRIQKEEETFMPFSAANTSFDLLLLNSPLQDGGGIKTIKEITKSISQTYWEENPDVYERAAGPLIFQEAGKTKEWNYFFKSLGLSGGLIDPATSIERENSDFFN
jgi:hypothetical protein